MMKNINELKDIILNEKIDFEERRIKVIVLLRRMNMRYATNILGMTSNRIKKKFKVRFVNNRFWNLIS